VSATLEANGRVQRRGWLIWVALLLSLTLNICFVGGLIWSRFALERFQSPQERFQELGRDLNLTEPQKADFQKFVQTLRQRTRLLQDSTNPLLERIWSELEKPTDDQALVDRLLAEATDNRESYQKDTAVALTTFMASLTPEQRSRLAAFAAPHRDPLSRRIWWLVVP
jgi:uncharacterized membrane protein